MNLRLPLRHVGAAVAVSAPVALIATSACAPSRTPPPPLESAGTLSMKSIADETAGTPREVSERGILLARPGRPDTIFRASGRVSLRLGGARDPDRDGFLYVPRGIVTSEPAPLVVFLHGAGGNADQAGALLSFAEQSHTLVLAIDSRATTWDLIEGELGPDVAFLDRALRWTFARFTVDPSRIAVAGFSDGASYALSLGLANGELFQTVLAFSPGFIASPANHGRPRIFISHGTDDRILPIERCSRRIVPRLEQAGYAIEYREFDGAHSMPPDIVHDAFEWLLGTKSTRTRGAGRPSA